jgi:hypothetical protein
MKKLAILTVVLSCASLATAQPGGPWGQVPDISGTWYMGGNPRQPCEIIQRRPDGRALFVNENGSQAWGRIDPNGGMFIPDWNEGRGQRGRLRGNRIEWPGGSYWSRFPERGQAPPPYYGPDGNYGGGNDYSPPWGRGARPW